ncbi:hypothetical protein Cfla_1826 [Cellulomonas flavigena DSM 20109]|uniref:Prepilin-type N-terminal cleavage/methylation domain-containing protein n=1 Tax=Cellulomonas flavigena (strain ATCC 482 / DSM 20109 / BCRC 11376 / JCM 18109 / NBRC 3775 / NCIMB 8073 / NRS 134) TaxID=446466 RepID=D5UER3_CELFN|nr:prepilin-type N-terminal cleavage/methylation domain-containing protein [Cellulomonas flavigena]ADG74723.1 hypothetical protein Cfla_1826 [Cellulomonas flavigena DSM 20109]
MESQERPRDDAGFTLVEVIIAMVITVVVMMTLAVTVVGALTTVAQARQRQTATALATQELERLRAQPYDRVTQQDPAYPAVTAAYVTTTAGVVTFAPPARLLSGPGEPLVVNAVSGKAVNQVVDGITYTVQTYVTRPAPTASGSQPFNLTVVVKWTSTVRPDGREVVQRSTTFSPAGCLSTATSPFAAPCQSYYTIRAGESLAGLTVSSDAGPDQLIAGMDAPQLRLDLTRSSASILAEQTVSGTSAAETSGASKASATTTGGEAAGAAVDSDPSSTPQQSVSTATAGKTASTLAASGPGGVLAVRPSTADSGGARAAVAAPSSICTGAAGSGLVTGAAGAERPCASSNIQASGGASVLTYTSPSGTAVELASFAAAGTSSRSVAGILGSANSGVCASGSPVNCGHAGTARTLGASIVGGAAVSAAPAGFTASRGLFSLSGLTESARAEEGPSAQTPSYTRAGTLWVWDGTGYQTVNLATFATPATGVTPVAQSWQIPPTAVTYAGGVTLTYEGTVTVQRPRVERFPVVRTGNVAVDCKADACTTSVDASAAVTANVTVVVTGATGELTRFALAANLGGLTADSSFKAAANA